MYDLNQVIKTNLIKQYVIMWLLKVLNHILLLYNVRYLDIIYKLQSTVLLNKIIIRDKGNNNSK